MLDLINTAILFIAPGAALKIFSEYIRTTEKREAPRATVYENIFSIVAVSFMVSFISFLLLEVYLLYYGKPPVATLTELMEEMNRIKFLAKWILLDGCVLIGIYFLKNKVKNRIRKFMYEKSSKNIGVINAAEDGKSVWENIFFDLDTNSKTYIAELYRDGEFVTAGIIEQWNSGYMPKRELRIERTSEVDRIIEHDQKNTQNKWLDYIDFEYYDTENGLLIKFYDATKALEHWDEL